MSVGYYAYSIIGVEIDKELILEEGKVRNCYHELPSEDMKYCPECGKPAFSIGRVNNKLPELDEESEIDGLDIYSNENSYFIGIVTRCHNYDNDKFISYDDLDINKLKNKIKKLLEPLGLWENDNFGFYTMLEAH